VKKRVLLICPETFYDHLEWEGVPLQGLLEKAQGQLGAGFHGWVKYMASITLEQPVVFPVSGDPCPHRPQTSESPRPDGVSARKRAGCCGRASEKVDD